MDYNTAYKKCAAACDAKGKGACGGFSVGINDDTVAPQNPGKASDATRQQCTLWVAKPITEDKCDKTSPNATAGAYKAMHNFVRE